MSWFIESWSPLAGQAFAVHRNYTYSGPLEEQRDERIWLDPDEVHLVAPPDFLPVPCAGAATALWATRGPFQHRFLRDDGTEFAFESLSQLVELVRRTYLVGGMSPPPTADVPPPPLPDVTPSAAEWAEVLRALNDRDASALNPKAPGVIVPPDPAMVDRAAKAIERCMSAQQQGLTELSISCLQALSRERAAGGRPDARDEVRWALLAAEMNEWQDWVHAAHVILGRLMPARAPFPYPGYWPLGAASGLGDGIFDGLLFRVPAPALPVQPPWPARLGYLGDHLMLAMADPRYVRLLLPTAREALPLFVSALAVAAATSWDFRSGMVEDGFRAVRAKAARWLVELLPNEQARIPGADFVMDQVHEHRAGGRP